MKTLPLFLDYASTTPVSDVVLEAMLPYFKETYGNPASRSHAHGWLAEEAYVQSKETIAKELDCSPSEIIFTSGATESINLALKGAEVEQVITFATEHKATLDVAGHLGIKSIVLSVDQNGYPNWEEVSKAAKLAPSLISFLWVNNETGVIFPIKEIQKVKAETNSLLHVDATQAVGKIPVSFKNSGVDMLSFSAHKIFGPKGVGALLVKTGVKLNPQIVGGGQQRNRRSGTLNIPGIVGLAKAVENSNISEELDSLKSYFEAEVIATFPSFKINGKESKRVSHISNIQFTGYDGEEVLQKLHKIAVSNGSACNSATTLPSHVLKAMGLSDEAAFSSIRFSFCANNTKADIDFTLEHMKEVLGS